MYKRYVVRRGKVYLIPSGVEIPGGWGWQKKNNCRGVGL